MQWWITDDLCPNIVRRLRERTRPFVSIVSPDGRLEHISVKDLHDASDRAAWFLFRNLKKDEERFFYMGPNDIRYLVICPSPSNTVSANLQFFSTVGAKKLLYAPESSSSLSSLLESTDKTITSMPTPSYSEMLDKNKIDEFPFPYTFDEIKDKPFRHPKPIYWNHAALASVVIPFDFSILPDPPKRPHLLLETLQGNNVFLPFPLYHFGGIGMMLRSFLTDSTIVLPAPGTKLSPENFAKMLRISSSTSTLTPPSILEAMLKSPCGLEVISRLKHVAYSGGPLNPVLGEKLAKVVPHMFPLYGCTEGAGPYLESTGDNTYWNGMKFIDLGQRMEEAMPGLYELVITRTDFINRTQAYFHTCPHLEVFRTADLFAPIKGSDGWWTFRGRTDNWITMSNGLKMDPTDMENAISAHPDVKGVLVAGSHRFRLCLLIELIPESAPKSDEERENILEALWPTIEKANKAAPKFGQVPKELIIFTSPDKPFGRASKGTIQRRLSIAAYDDEIENLYAKVEEGFLTMGLPPLKSTRADDLLPFLRNLYSETLNNHEIGVGDDLFHKGLDSLSIFLLAARIKAGLRKHNVSEKVLKKVDNALLFTYTTITRLTQKLSYVLSERNGITKLTNGSSNVNELRNLLMKYEAKIPTILRDGRRRGHTIVLTGSGGSLGSYILSALLVREDVKKVYCLNRSSDAQAEQKSSFKAKGLPLLPLERARFLQANLAEPNLGLTDDEYASLTLESTTIIHNAYPVNFLMPVESFEPQIQGLLNLLQLAQDSVREPAVLFISSIAAALPASGSRTIVKETVLDISESGSLLQQGYGQSKFICEKLVEKYASSSGGGKGAILRVGQIAGPLRGPGVWNVWEWAPSMILSSKYLGAAPESVGSAPVDWIPVDALGQIVSELMDDVAQRESGAVSVYNVLNPTATSWKELLGAVKETVPETVPAAEWIAKLEKSQGAGAHTLDQNPGLKLLDFYKQAFLNDGGKQALVVEKHNLLWGSQTARELLPVKPEHLAKWMKGWGLQ
ncbi:acetyl-CoA synthetase-like protein [Xylariaceae sp. AK1471]|nr:acetyl-CoA synthetase-like protein [Xylariaceae sp. AK1471]